jgi:hypothetical protein
MSKVRAFLAPLAGLAIGTSVLMAGPAYAAQGPVGLGTADSFAVLAGSGITNTGATTITGDVGTFPTPSETGFGSVTLHGTNHHGDAVTKGAKNDLVTAYNDAAGRKPVTNLPAELGGLTLLPGVYRSPTFGLTGTLTLNGAGETNPQFIFQAGSTITTASDSRVVLINGAQACDVVWQIGSSATFTTGTDFIGNVLAHTSITAQTGATFQGRLLASVGAVTLDHNTITRATCAAVTPTPSPTPTKTASPKPSSSPTAKPTKSATPKPSSSSTSKPKPKPSITTTKTPGGGVTISTPTPTPSTPGHHHSSPPLPGLPFTGLPTAGLVGLAMGLFALGGMALVVGRRGYRRSH